MAGQVLAAGQRIDKPGRTIDVDTSLELLEPLRYVSRGGLKLEAALSHWNIDVTNRVCIDVGSSTGGFTDCLLQHGAARVYAIDVGTGQLDWKLRNDPRVVLREKVNARYLQPAEYPEAFDLASADVSFISVTMILPAVLPLLEPDAPLIVLVKPQFELERDQVGRGGIVRDPALHEAACRRVAGAVEALGYRTELMPSPITGAEGNREFLLYARH